MRQPQQTPSFFRFNSLGSLDSLPPLNDDRDSPRPTLAETQVEWFWSGMLEHSFGQIVTEAQRIEAGGCAFSWIPKHPAGCVPIEAVAGAIPWCSVQSLQDQSPDGTLTFWSYLKHLMPPLPFHQRAEALEACNAWNTTRMTPTALLTEIPCVGGPGLGFLLSAHIRVCHGISQAQVDRFIDDAMEGSDLFWRDAIPRWYGVPTQ